LSDFAGLTVHQLVDDADTLVAKVALQIAEVNRIVSVITNDTDILILLLSHYNSEMSDIFMYSQRGRNINSIRAIASALRPLVLRRLLVIHAISGCDSTSRLFGHGKVSIFKKLSKARDIQLLIDTLESSNASHEEIRFAGCELLVFLYGGNDIDSLNHLLYSSYMHITATSSQLPHTERLPPTENAARFRIYRVHLQVLH